MSKVVARFTNVESHTMFAVETVLDPRFKGTPFTSDQNFQDAKESILNELEKLAPPPATEPAPTSDAGAETDEPAKKKKAGLWGHYKEVFVKQSSSDVDVSPRVKLAAELNQYLLENTMDPKLGDKVGQYWTQSSHVGLKDLAKKYLCIPPCTVFSERLFSSASNICDIKRNRLDPDKVKMLVFLKCNLK